MSRVDFSRYKWRDDENKPGRFKREVGGGELFDDVLNFHKQGEQNLFLGTYIQTYQPLETSDLVRSLRKAWISLRWDVPTIAAQILHESREETPMPASFLTYTPPCDKDEIDSWANETVILREGFKDLDTLRYDIAHGILPDKDLVSQTFLYCTQSSETSFGLLLYTSHVPFDGVGVKVLMSRFLEHLSKYISDPDYEASEVTRNNWGTEHRNLLPIASEILRKHEPTELDTDGNITRPEVPEEPRDGPKYVETLNQVLADLARGVQVAHPFKSVKQPLYDQTKDTPLTRRASYTFSAEESKKIIQACQSAPDRLTVNHLAHGCLSLLTVLDNPPEPGSPNVVYYYGLVDSRQRLAKEYRGTLDYPGYCLGMSSIQVPVNIIDKFAAEDVSNNLKAIVLEFSQAVKMEYLRQAAFPALLAVENEQVELMLSAPPPPPWCGPWFGGDGRGAIYLKPKYPQQGNTVLEITDFYVGLEKTDPGPFFRITEWNGRIMLSADYNQKAVEAEVVDGWMKKWAELMMVLT